MALAVSSRARRSQIAARPRPTWRLSPVLVAAGLSACGLHVALWWGWTHQGLLGTQAAVAPAAVHVRQVEGRAGGALPSALGDPAAPGSGGEPAQLAATQVPLVQAEPTTAELVRSEQMPSERAIADGAPPVGGPQWLAGRYTPADQLDQSPRPELGWFLDEDVLAPLPHGSMLVQLWVSAEGRIDRVELLRADPPGDWALRALVPLPRTPMRPGASGGRPVAATLVVELVVDNERFR